MVSLSLKLNRNLSSELDEKQDLAGLVSHTPVKTERDRRAQPDLSNIENGVSATILPAQLAVSGRSVSLELNRDTTPNLSFNQAPISASTGLQVDSSPVATASLQPSQSTTALTSYFPLTCSCMACQSLSQGERAGTGTPQQGSSAASGDSRIDPLLGGNKWGTTTLTYSFYSGGSYYGSEAGLATVSDAVKANVRYILENVIEPLINLNFVEVTDSSATNSYGQIRYLNSTSPTYAYAYYPFSTDANQGNDNDLAGDVFLNSGYDNSSDTNGFQGGIGSHGYTTLIHETLHAVGLKHPGNYNGSGTGDSPFLPFNQDSLDNTVMSYNFTNPKPATLMAYDLLALQYLYGAKSLNAGNTNYTFSTVFGYADGVKTVGSSTSATKLTVWDSGGVDTLNFAGLESSPGYYFDLNEGGWLTRASAINSETYRARSDSSSSNYTTNGAGTRIGFGVTIENAIGTTSNDILVGNGADNGLSSGGGNDSLSGAAGNDTLAGSTGSSSLIGGIGSDVYYTQSIDDTIIENANEGTDTVRASVSLTLGANLERLGLQGTRDLSGTGNGLDNMLVGNTGNNVLDSQAGNDTLMGGGGSDTLIGGTGNDLFVVDNIGVSVVENANGGSDTVHSFINYTLGDNVERLGLQGTSNLKGAGNNLENTIVGNQGSNLLNGQAGRDTLSGGAGNDTLTGGISDDVLTGNTGNDWFLYATESAFATGAIGVDRLTDFGRTAGNTDKIALSSTTFNAGTSFANVASDALAAASGAFITFSTGTGSLFYNQNGVDAGFGSGGQFVTVSNVSSLLATDFAIVG
jgi:Ca2+-binding RTX toxin-like protein